MVLMYDRSSESTEVDDVTRQLFTQKSRILESVPPTQAALKQHIKRTCYQANCSCDFSGSGNVSGSGNGK